MGDDSQASWVIKSSSLHFSVPLLIFAQFNFALAVTPGQHVCFSQALTKLSFDCSFFQWHWLLLHDVCLNITWLFLISFISNFFSIGTEGPKEWTKKGQILLLHQKSRTHLCLEALFLQPDAAHTEPFTSVCKIPFNQTEVFTQVSYKVHPGVHKKYAYTENLLIFFLPTRQT